MLITIIGRGHSGTRSISHTLSASGVFMGEPLNESGDLIPPDKMYEACRIFGEYVTYEGGNRWDFSKAVSAEIPARFKELIEDYLHSVLDSHALYKGWKIPETTLVYPWIVRLFPDIRYIFWVRDPRDCILGDHFTDDLNDFGIEYDKTDNVRHNRAMSWFYQREIVRSIEPPAHSINVRFEDMVFDQDSTLERLSGFLGIPLAKIEMRPGSVGRYKSDTGTYMFDVFEEDMKELGYTW